MVVMVRLTEDADLALMKAYRAEGGWVPGEPPYVLLREKLVERAHGGSYRVTRAGRAEARKRAEKKWGVTI